MAIPSAQLEIWANPGAAATAQATYESIRQAIEVAGTSIVKGHSIDLFLQGSYRNATNIRGDSDVDVVVVLKETYTRDTSRLTQPQQQAEARGYQPATYQWWEFRRDVIASLVAYYGVQYVEVGNKSIKIKGQPGRLPADVVPAIDHWVYTSYGLTLLTQATNYVEGIAFWDLAGNKIVNFPKQHIENGQFKNGLFRANGNYKPTVRMFKNAREYLIDKRRLAEGVAPSYFVECLLYNVPDTMFGTNKQESMRAILQWLWTTNKNAFVCQNGQVTLFGDSSVQWQVQRADEYLAALVRMWGDWPI